MNSIYHKLNGFESKTSSTSFQFGQSSAIHISGNPQARCSSCSGSRHRALFSLPYPIFLHHVCQQAMCAGLLSKHRQTVTDPGHPTLDSVVHSDSSYPAPTTYSSDNMSSWFPRCLFFSSLVPLSSASMKKISATCGFNFHFYSCFSKCAYTNSGTRDGFGRYMAVSLF